MTVSLQSPPVLLSPTNLQMEHISLEAVLLRWDYNDSMTQCVDMLPVSVRFLVQCDRDGNGFANASDLLNGTVYTFNLLCQITKYQFRVLAYKDGMFSEPSLPTYAFLNGVTGMYLGNVVKLSNQDARKWGHQDSFCCSKCHVCALKPERLSN